MRQTHDVIVLGAGSGGLATAFRAAKYGASVALLDPGDIGGTCVHRGCVPKKALWNAAQLAQAQRLALEYGFASQPGALDWPAFRRLRGKFIGGIDQRYQERLGDASIELIREAGRCLAADTVALAGGRLLKAPHVVLATGARPRRLALPGFDLGLVSDDMFRLDAMPARIGIVGGGYVAVEFAGLLSALGARVEMLLRDALLDSFDTDMVKALASHMQEQGITMTRGTSVSAARRDGDGLRLDDASGPTHGPYDAVLWAVGRVPNSEKLGLQEIGVDTDEHGHVTVDQWQNTSVPGVYAVGDLTQGKALTPVASAAGRRLMDRLFGGQPGARMDHDYIPSVVFAEPPLGMVGLTEAQAREQHGDAVSVHETRFHPLAWRVAGREAQGVMKLVCVGEQERVMGIHVLGPGADEMLQGFAVAIRMGLHKRDLDTTIAIHPTGAEELLLMG